MFAFLFGSQPATKAFDTPPAPPIDPAMAAPPPPAPAVATSDRPAHSAMPPLGWTPASTTDQPSAPPAAEPNGPPVASTDAPKEKPVDEKAMAESANKIFKSMDGLWVSGGDKSNILDELRGKSPAEVSAIKASYADHFPGHNMDEDLGKNLDGKDLDEAKASMSGDPVAAAVASIQNAETGTFFGNCDSDKVTKILSGITDPKVRAQVKEQIGGDLASVQDGNDKELSQALLDGDTAKASAVKLDTAMNGGLLGGGGFLGTGIGQDSNAMYDAISNCKDATERAKMEEAYKNKTGTDLKVDLDMNLDGAAKDVATNLLSGDKAAADAARVKAATEGFFTDKSAIYKQLDGKSPEERALLIKKFNAQYGEQADGESFDDTLKDNMSGKDLDKAKMLEKDGKLSDTFALNYAMNGSFFSTDKDAIKSTLTGKSPAEVDKLCAQYQKDFGIDLKTELADDTSGRDGFEIKELMKGEPTTLEDKVARAHERYDFERGNSGEFSKNVIDAFSDKGTMLDSQENRVDDLFARFKSGEATPQEKAELEKVVGYQQMDVKTYDETKDKAANGLATGAAIAAAAVVTIATAGTAAPALAAAGAALAGGTASMITKEAILGDDYSREDMRNDAIQTGVGVLSAGSLGALSAAGNELDAAGGALRQFAGSVTESSVGQEMVIQGTSGAVTSAATGVSGGVLAGKENKDIFQAGLTGLVTGGVGGVVTGGIGERFKAAPEGFDPVNYATVKGGIAGGLGAAAGNAFNPDAYKGDAGAIATNWLGTVGGGAIGGAASGYGEGKARQEELDKLAQDVAAAKDSGKTGITKEEQADLNKLGEFSDNQAEQKELQKVEQEIKDGKQVIVPADISESDPNRDLSQFYDDKKAPKPAVVETPVTPETPVAPVAPETPVVPATATTGGTPLAEDEVKPNIQPVTVDDHHDGGGA